MDWETLYCPNQSCGYFGVPFRQSRLVKNGTSYGQPQALCKSCGRSVALSYATAYYGLESAHPLFEMAVRALAEGTSLRATGRILQVDKDTVCAWLQRAAGHCREVMLYLWRQLPVTECQLDELWSFVHTKEAHLPCAKLDDETYGDAWVWLAVAPVWRLVLAFVVGKRTQAQANLLVQRVKAVTAAQVPFFTSDQFPEYEVALLQTYGCWERPARQGTRGRLPHPRLVPSPHLRYAQVVKERVNGRVVNIETRIVFGAPEEVAAHLETSAVSQVINTSFVERQNLTARQQNRRLARKTNGFSKDLGWLEKQLWLSLAYYHLVLPHQSLRQRLTQPTPTRGHGTPKQWQPMTPAMAADLTDHVWSTAELLSYRVPAPFLAQLSTGNP